VVAVVQEDQVVEQQMVLVGQAVVEQMVPMELLILVAAAVGNCTMLAMVVMVVLAL
jgi:hypothetical protein